MSADGSSYLGLAQSRLEIASPVVSLAVGPQSETRRSKKDKGHSLLRQFLAANVMALRDRHPRYKALPNITARNRLLAADADVSPSQVYRVIEGSLGASIDIVERLAMALDVRPHDLLTPYFHRSTEAADKPPTRPVRQEIRELQRR
jgi:hypothetical protein